MSNVKRGVYVLPNLFTSANLFFGFYAIVYALRVTLNQTYNYHTCAYFIVLAALFDMMDGSVARKTNTASKFGIEYDSLCDLVSFGVAPAITMYLWLFQSMGRLGWVICFLYCACAALRLARFNVQAGSVENKNFQGMPVPMAALLLSGLMLLFKGQQVVMVNVPIVGSLHALILISMIFISLMMVSNIPYRNAKSLSLTKKLPFYTLPFMVLGIVVWAVNPLWIMFISGFIYGVSGPVEYLIRKAINKPMPAPTPKQNKSESKDVRYLYPKNPT